ncbi:MAG: ferrous iron transport protein B [Saprospiraceae bacterium]|nr:ferrous iron transport protein B [Saprospiraceae bacterium]MCF8249490.1 ferrous iron transport protein B [Saprospiraceae bacterium]MCF8280114.1 ferrous iron transport protein B [Bacteroidales bacterium]MCF8310708.1 ferrous iron transport protein B [Saprospiraceae bacterium]MCF8439461.1 ferrous iron transport protein B [Saprospiraceae bacterium]
MNTVALAGNPNSGKSSIFNQLTGLRQKVANFPGVTVEKKSGKLQLPDGEEVVLVDFPGAYSLYPNSEDERVVLNVLANPNSENFPDAVVYVADVTGLDKHFLLLTQIKDLGLPCVLALNMADTAEQEGIVVDTQRLSEFLQMPVINVSGRTGANMDILKEHISELLRQERKKSADPLYQPGPMEENTLGQVQQLLGIENPYRALLVAHHALKLPYLTSKEKSDVTHICEMEGFNGLRLQIVETMRRFELFTPVLQKAIVKKAEKTTLSDRLDAVLTHPTYAPIIFFGVMFVVFQAMFSWASYPMDWIEMGFGWAAETLKAQLPAGWFTDLLTEGILSGLGGIVVFVPQIAILFLLVTLLEEVGYMSRAVFIFDKIMQQFGLNGRSVVALVSGGACAIPAIMSTRTISNWKERLITILVTPLISCSARIPVYTVLIGFVVPPKRVLGLFNAQGLAFMGLYMMGIVAALGSAWVLKKLLKSSEPSWLMMQLPPYRLPVWRNVGITIWEKTSAFVLGAGKVILVASVILWGLASYGPSAKMEAAKTEATLVAQQKNLDETATGNLVASYEIEASFAGHLGKFIEPVIRPLGFDWKIGIALITSFAAREVFVATMATIYSIGSTDDEGTIHNRLAQAHNPETGEKVYTAATSASLLVFYVFALQCMSTLAVVRRETGTWKWPLVQFGFMGLLAYFGSWIAFQLLS